MPVFSYTAIDAGGKTVAGEVTVPSKREAYEHLERGKLNPVEVKSAGEVSASKTSGGVGELKSANSSVK